VDYFDFYLLHNVNEKTMKIYLDPSLGIIDYFMEQKKKGRIKHFGFSCHARTKGLREFLDACGDVMEFGQLQLNYLDWTLQDAKGKYELLTKRGIPVWVMEPVRGGKLAQLPEADEAALKALRPEDSIASWGFRFLQGLPNVKMILSGMSNMAQMEDNVKTFSEYKQLTAEETTLILDVAESLKDSVPCTGCRYCCDGCPMELDIPGLLGTFNELKISPSVNSAMRIEFAPEDKKPTACIGCGQCVQICPQNIDIPLELKNLTEKLKTIPSWAETCRQREKEAKQK
jgi:predicted aldo/keto reductase-like oxidoreductase